MPSWLCLKTATTIRIFCVACIIAVTAISQGKAQTATAWDQPAASLAAQVADILGPGPAAFSIRNLSSIPADQLPAIRKSLESNLKVHGVTAGGSDSANSVRVTLSENARERLWVAEIIEGNETKVAMVELGSIDSEAEKIPGALVLRRQTVLVTQDPILAALEIPSGLLTLEPEQVVLYTKIDGVWKEQQHARLGSIRTIGRDPRGVLLGSTSGSSAEGTNFDAWLPGVHCSGTVQTNESSALKITCGESDDPWAITPPTPGAANALVAPIRAFYNTSRNSFTGVLVPNLNTELPPFYSLAIFERAAGPAVLAAGIDGKVQLAENGSLHTVAGTRDWGSDLAVLQSGCGSGAQVVVSGSGDAANDSLRAYELPSFEAVAASEPIEVDGSVMALDSEANSKSLLAIVRRTENKYEVDRVTALCN